MYDDFEREEISYAVRYREETPLRSERLLLNAKRNQSGREKQATQARFGRGSGSRAQCGIQHRGSRIAHAA